MFVSHPSSYLDQSPILTKTSISSWCRLIFWSLIGAVAHPGGYPTLAPLFIVLALRGLFHEHRFGSPHLKTLVWGTVVGCGQLIWMATPTYVGTWCLAAAPLLGFAIGLQWMVWSRWGIRGASPYALIQAGFFWALLEFSRELWLWSGLGFGSLSTVLTAFPLGALFANVFGHYGISWWIVTLSLLCWRHPLRLVTWFWAAIPFIYGVLFSFLAPVQFSSPIKITGIQTGEYPTVDGRGSTFSERWEHLHMQLESISKSNSAPDLPHLIVLPESVLRLDVDDPLQAGPEPYTLDDYYADWAQLLQASIIAGIDWHDWRGYRTGQGLYTPDGARLRYAKRKLVFGAEFIPYRWMKGLLKPFGIEDGFIPGELCPTWAWPGGQLTPATCYESAFAGDLRQACVHQSALIAVSINDGWYGESSLREHHAAAAQLRSIELGRPVFQVGHTGISGLWCPFGKSLCQRESPERGTVAYEGPLTRVSTPWVFWGNWGWLILGGLLSLALAVGVRRKRKFHSVGLIHG